MSKDLLPGGGRRCQRKGVDKNVIFDAMETALASAAKKRYVDQDVAVRVSIDRERRLRDLPAAGSRGRRHRDGVTKAHDPPDGLTVDEKPGIEVGEFIEEQIENPEFGRIAAQAAKRR